MVSTILTFIASILFFSISFVLYFYVQNLLRARHVWDYRLIPNCLLTRRPVVFVSGHESPFYRGNFWNGLPNAMREHGYEIIEISRHEVKSLIAILQEEKISCHWIVSPDMSEALNKLQSQHPQEIVSLTTPEIPKDAATVFDLGLTLHAWVSGKKIHPFMIAHPRLQDHMTVIKFYLKILCNLAEQDFQQNDSQHYKQHTDQQHEVNSNDAISSSTL